MKSALYIFILIALIEALSCSSTGSNTAKYSSKLFPAVELILKDDSLFTFMLNEGNYSDSTTGTYTFRSDTLCFNYSSKHQEDSPRSGKTVGGFLPLSVVYSPKKAMLRPNKLFKQGGRLYYFDEVSGKTLTTSYQNRVEELYLERIN